MNDYFHVNLFIFNSVSGLAKMDNLKIISDLFAYRGYFLNYKNVFCSKQYHFIYTCEQGWILIQKAEKMGSFSKIILFVNIILIITYLFLKNKIIKTNVRVTNVILLPESLITLCDLVSGLIKEIIIKSEYEM